MWLSAPRVGLFNLAACLRTACERCVVWTETLRRSLTGQASSTLSHSMEQRRQKQTSIQQEKKKATLMNQSQILTQCCFSYIVLYKSTVSCFFPPSQALDIFIIKKKKITSTKMASFPKSLSVHYAMNNLAFTTTWTLKPIAHPGLRHLSLLVRLFVVCLFLTVASDLVDHHPFPPNVASWKDHRVRLYRSGKKVSPYILLSDEIWEQQVVAVSSHFLQK